MTIDIRQAFASEPPALDFVLPGYLAGTVGCIAAAGSTGKSFWGMEAAMSVASASADAALLQLKPQHHGKVVILNAEDPETVIRKRLFDIGSYLPQEARDDVSESLQIEALVGKMTNLLDLKWQDSILRVADGARLLILDTLSRWHKMNENDNGQMGAVLAVMEMIADKTGAAVLFLHHVSKGMAVSGRQDEQQATRGAAAITDNARWQGYLQTMDQTTAVAMGIEEPDRKSFVQFGGNKENYGQSQNVVWLKRGKGGVLLPATFETKKIPANKGARREANY